MQIPVTAIATVVAVNRMLGTPKSGGLSTPSSDSAPTQNLWDAQELWSYPATALLTGTMGSLLGIGGGMVIGPVLLALNLPPQVSLGLYD